MNLHEKLEKWAGLHAVIAAYGAFSLPVPEWLSLQTDELRAEIERDVRDELKRQLALAKARVEVLKPADQKRHEAADLVAELEAKLAKV